jgi:hypothetical protein
LQPELCQVLDKVHLSTLAKPPNLTAKDFFDSLCLKILRGASHDSKNEYPEAPLHLLPLYVLTATAPTHTLTYGRVQHVRNGEALVREIGLLAAASNEDLAQESAVASMHVVAMLVCKS